MEATQQTRDVSRSLALRRTARQLLADAPMGERIDQQRCGARPVPAKAKGAVVTDVDGNEYIDYEAAAGTAILGYADERIVVAVNKAVAKGGGIGDSCDAKTRLAELVISRYPSLDRVRFLPSAHDAIREAMELARAFTGRRSIVRFATVSSTDLDTVTLPIGDGRAALDYLSKQGPETAAVLIEPLASRAGLVRTEPRFLRSLRRACDEHNVLLLFDETFSAFRLDTSAYAAEIQASSDMTILAGPLGGGLPLAAYGGRKNIMEAAPEDPLATPDIGLGLHTSLAAGIATLQAMGVPIFYETLENLSLRLDEGLRAASASAGIELRHVRIAGMVGLFFHAHPGEGENSNRLRFERFIDAMLDQGILLPSDPQQCLFVSTSHTQEMIDRTVEAAHRVLGDLQLQA